MVFKSMKEIKISKELEKMCPNISLACVYYNTEVESSSKEVAFSFVA